MTDLNQIATTVKPKSRPRPQVMRLTDAAATRIRELTTAEPFTIGPDATVEEAARVMVERNFHHLPVVEGDRLLGIVDLVDVCRSVLSLDT